MGKSNLCNIVFLFSMLLFLISCSEEEGKLALMHGRQYYVSFFQDNGPITEHKVNVTPVGGNSFSLEIENLYFSVGLYGNAKALCSIVEDEHTDEKTEHFAGTGNLELKNGICNHNLVISGTMDDNCIYLCITLDSGDVVTGKGGVKRESVESEIKILCIGNSFTEDSFLYVPAVLRLIAPDVKVTLGIAYYGGAGLEWQLSILEGKEHFENGELVAPYPYYLRYYKNVNGAAWVTKSIGNGEIVTAADVLIDEDWDIVTLQQNSANSYTDYEKDYAPYIDRIIDLLYEKGRFKSSVAIGWNSIHSASSYIDGCTAIQKWEKITENSRRVMQTGRFSLLFPYGTAVQNLRTVPEINALGNSVEYMRDRGDDIPVGSPGELLADTGHLQDGIGCLTAACANAITILKYLGYDYDCDAVKEIRIDDNFYSKWAIIPEGRNPSPDEKWYPSIIGCDSEQSISYALKAAECAVADPFNISDLTCLNDGCQ